MVKQAHSGNMGKANEIYRCYLPLIVFEQQPGLAIRKEILRLRGLLTTSCVRHPGANIDTATAQQLRDLIATTFEDNDITQPLTIS